MNDGCSIIHAKYTTFLFWKILFRGGLRENCRSERWGRLSAASGNQGRSGCRHQRVPVPGYFPDPANMCHYNLVPNGNVLSWWNKSWELRYPAGRICYYAGQIRTLLSGGDPSEIKQTHSVREELKMTDRQEELIEIYRLHTEMADRVSQRREGANRLFVILLTGLMAVGVALITTNSSTEPKIVVFLLLGSIGLFVSASWYVIIRSYRQLNTGKFKTLQQLEKSLIYPFFTREWELLKEGREYRTYWKLTIAETSLPILFFVLSILFIVLGLIQL